MWRHRGEVYACDCTKFFYLDWSLWEGKQSKKKCNQIISKYHPPIIFCLSNSGYWEGYPSCHRVRSREHPRKVTNLS